MYLNKRIIREASLIEKIKINILLIVMFVQRLIISLFNALLFKPITQLPQKILIYRFGSIGDCVCALPAIHNIKQNYPDATIDIENSSVDSNFSFLKELIPPYYYKKFIISNQYSKGEYRRMLKNENYDCFIILMGRKFTLLSTIKRMIFIRWSGIKYSIGWEVEFIPFFRQTQEKFFLFEQEIDRLNRIMSRNNITQKLPNRFPLNITVDAEDRIKQLLQENTLNKPSIAVVVGASKDYKEWPIIKFQEVIKSLSDRYNIYVIGGKDDFQKAQKLSHIVNLCGQLSIIESAVLLKKCLFTIANDTGPMHLSYAVGTPVVGIFSNWDFSNIWFPPNDGLNQVVRGENIPCSICLQQICDNNNLCIDSIDCHTVLKSFKQLEKKYEA